MRPVLVVGFVACFLSLSTAQTTPRFEVFGGYSYLHPSAPDLDAHGWEAAGTYNLNRWFGLKADFSGHYWGVENTAFQEHQRRHTFLFGPQLSWRRSRGTLFAHGLLGVQHMGVDAHFIPPVPGPDISATENSFAVTVGGGGDLNLGHRLAWRVAQVDYLHKSGLGPRSNVRVSTGLVFRFGEK
jgi:hypothetical protein